MESSRTALSGDLEFLNLGDVLQLLGTNGSTGILRLRSDYAKDSAFIYLAHGDPINASSGLLTGLEAVYSLFGWTQGHFEFTPEDISSENVIQKSRMEIILDGLRKVDDGIIKKLGPESSVDVSSESSEHDKLVPTVKGPFVDYSCVVDREERLDGEIIVEEGKYGNWVFVILEGAADILKDTPKGPLRILRLGQGAFVGSISSLLRHGEARSASGKAVGKVQLGVLDSQELYDDAARMSSEFRALALSLDKRLRQVTATAVGSYLKRTHSKELTKYKDPIVSQGKIEQRIFTINRGEATVVQNSNGSQLRLANLGKGDIFGYIPFLHMEHEPYSAAVYASKDLEVSMSDPERLAKEYRGLPPTLRNMLDHVATCISLTSRAIYDGQFSHPK